MVVCGVDIGCIYNTEESMSIEEEVISNEGINSNAGTDLNAGTNQRFVRAFRSHFKMLVDVLDPEEAALALYQEKLISKTTLEEALSSNGSKFKRSYKIVDAMETYLGICTSTTTALVQILTKTADLHCHRVLHVYCYFTSTTPIQFWR